MKKLHLLNSSPRHTEPLQQCLRLMGDQDGIVLMEDGVLWAKRTPINQTFFERVTTDQKLYAVSADLSARGIASNDCLEKVTVINYEEFVNLTINYAGTHSWS